MAPRKGSKRRKAAATQDETVETRTAGFGDNSQLALPAPDDYAHHFKTIKGLKEKSATAASLLRHAKTQANKSCTGLAADIEDTLAIEREGDPVKLKKRLELKGIGLKHIGSTIQVSVFDTLKGEVSDQAYQRGLADGKGGKSANPGYPEGSDLANDYSRGWQEGMASNVSMSDEDRAQIAAE